MNPGSNKNHKDRSIGRLGSMFGVRGVCIVSACPSTRGELLSTLWQFGILYIREACSSETDVICLFLSLPFLTALICEVFWGWCHGHPAFTWFIWPCGCMGEIALMLAWLPCVNPLHLTLLVVEGDKSARHERVIQVSIFCKYHCTTKRKRKNSLHLCLQIYILLNFLNGYKLLICKMLGQDLCALPVDVRTQFQPSMIEIINIWYRVIPHVCS